MFKQRYEDIDAGSQLQPYRLIFMDYSMPLMDGIETTQAIIEAVRERGYDPRNTNESPYICCLSAYDEESYIEKAMKAGMHQFMTKPADAH